MKVTKRGANYLNLIRNFPYSVQIWENTDQKNSLFERILHSVTGS